MLIKVKLEFLDGEALKKAIEKELVKVVDDRIPLRPGRPSTEVMDERSALYDSLYDNAAAAVDFMKERSYAIFDFDFDIKKAKLVGVA